VSPRLAGKRVLILAAETEIGRAVTTAVAEAGASVAAVAATSDAEAAFAVQRLAGRLSSGERKVIAQAIDATNEAAVRVMVRQVSKELSGLDAVVYHWTPKFDRFGGPYPIVEFDFINKFGGKELRRLGDGTIVLIMDASWGEPTQITYAPPGAASMGFKGTIIPAMYSEIAGPISRRPLEDVISEVLSAIAGEPDSG
jgi:hypothetical protein